MTVPMALVDMIPVIMFLISAIILQKDLHNKMSPVCFGVFAGGSFMIFFAGMFKAIWKLLMGAGVCDFRRLSDCLLPLQGTGFIMMAVALFVMLSAAKKKKKGAAVTALAAAPALYEGTMVFIPMMCLGVGAISTALSILAAKLGRKKLTVLFVLVFFLMLGMGYLSSKDFANPMLNWCAEGVNILGQGTLMAGTMALHKAKLGELEL